jgi:hypothetical protein
VIQAVTEHCKSRRLVTNGIFQHNDHAPEKVSGVIKKDYKSHSMIEALGAVNGKCRPALDDSAGNFVDGCNESRDTTQKLTTGSAFVELDVRGRQTLVHDIHNLGHNVVSFRVLWLG